MAKKTKPDTTIETSVEAVREAVSAASRLMDSVQYRAFLEALMAEAEGWKMELEEEDDEDD